VKLRVSETVSTTVKLIHSIASITVSLPFQADNTEFVAVSIVFIHKFTEHTEPISFTVVETAPEIFNSRTLSVWFKLLAKL
jgi:hypothetical protein